LGPRAAYRINTATEWFMSRELRCPLLPFSGLCRACGSDFRISKLRHVARTRAPWPRILILAIKLFFPGTQVEPRKSPPSLQPNVRYGSFVEIR